MIKITECDHDWEYIKGSVFELQDTIEPIIEREVRCNKCGQKGIEVWIYSDTIEE